MARRKRKTEQKELVVRVKSIDPTTPGSFMMAMKSFSLWDRMQDMSQLTLQADKLFSVLNSPNLPDEKREAIANEIMAIEEKIREIGRGLLEDIKLVVTKHIEVEGGTPEEALEHMSLEEVRQIVRTVAQDPFAFLATMTSSEADTGEDEG